MKKQNHQIVWLSLENFFERAIKYKYKEEDFLAIADKDLVSDLVKRKQEIEKFYWSMMVFVITLSAMLYMNIVSDKSEVSFLGISSKGISGAKEVIVVVCSTLFFFCTAIRSEISYLKRFINSINRVKYKENHFIHKNRFGDMIGYMPSATEYFCKEISASNFIIILYILLAIFLSLAAIFISVGQVYVLGVILCDLLKKPNFSFFHSIFIVAYSIIVYLAYFLSFAIFNFPMPYRSYEKLYEMIAAKEDIST